MTLLLCSHARAAFIYTEALAKKCTLWGVKSEKLNLGMRYDTYKYKLERDADG
jgi:hypothetical protein